VDSPLFLVAVTLTVVGLLGATIVAPLVAAWWARSSAMAWSAATAVLAVLLVVAIAADRAVTVPDAGRAGMATLLAVGPMLTSTIALARTRRADREIPAWLFVTYVVPLGAFCLGLALYVVAALQTMSAGPVPGTVSSAITLLVVWVAGVVLVGALAGTIALMVGLLRSRHREVSE
jgi:hypothetical protein